MSNFWGTVRSKRLHYLVILLLLSLVFTLPLFSKLHNTGRSDWDFYCFMQEVPRQTILEYHQFPLWNPYAGGRPLLANPQVGFLSPTFLLSLAFGCVVGLKLEVFLMVAIGAIGMFWLSQHYKMTPIAGMLASSLFVLSSFFSLHITEGHVIFLSFYLMPYVFLFFLKSLEQKTHLISAAIFFTVILAEGVTHLLVPITIFLAAYSAVLSVERRNLRPVFSLALILCLFFGFSAIKMVPTVEYLLEHPRLTISEEVTDLEGVYHIFLGRDQSLFSKHFESQTWGWHEYGAYTGIIPMILFAAGLFWFWKKETALILSGLLMFVISLGDFGGWSPWHVLHQMPLLESTRAPSRFVIMFVFGFAIIAGLAADFLLKRMGQSYRKTFLYALAVVVVVDLLSVNSKTFTQAFPNDPVSIPRDREFRQIVDSNPTRSGATSSMYLNLLANNGTVNVYEAVPQEAFARGVGDPSYKGEVFVEAGGYASYSHWSPNKLAIKVQVEKDTRLVINQNYDKGWRIEGGRKAENTNGLLSTQVSPKDNEVVFYYLPSSFMIGTVISFLSILCVAVLWVPLGKYGNCVSHR